MRRVLQHIELHLAEPLDLKTLAEVAHFSPFHFHRLFAAWMGETLGDYLRRRRLERAAQRLRADATLPVLHAALDVGFGSGEAFARAFKQHFGTSPSTWRRNPDQADRNRRQASEHRCRDDGLPFNEPEHPMNELRLIDLPPARVAYLRYTGPYGPALGEFWAHRFMPWVAAQGLQGRTLYGISHDDPSVTPPSECRCDTAVEVDEDFRPPGDAHLTTLPGGRYAAMHFVGTGAEIGEAWRALLGQWLPSSGFQIDNRPCFERYRPEDFPEAKGERFACDVCIPVVPL